MARMKLLKKVVEDMKQLTISLEEFCLSFESDDASSVVDKGEETIKTSEPKLDLETVRGILAEKSRLGFTKEIKRILSEFGVSKLGDLNQSDYADLLEKVEVLSND
ncbi:hypothetical protein I4Q36_04995 [Tuanshanicoccus lijuaniae]|uniref:hypothetical protein n=1 Tax=Aerococcaceae bacterium zg-1292 TaxID=2774330 RepID=UPI001935BC5C|nr:hypothetical protein [Aerococcaceae bacterium zg-1292]QQA38033.1 hypothetical protein I4Q36_04995 [Aerococcaceae bacterium zg-1292]